MNSIANKPSWLALPLSLVVLVFAGRQPARAQDAFSHFLGLTNFSAFIRSTNTDGSVILLSPELKCDAPWNELIVSWNADAPTNTWLTVEASARWPDHASKFYGLGLWTRANLPFPRASISGQRDADGTVNVDTLVLNHTTSTVQIRVTLGGTNSLLPDLKFLALAFCNTNITPAILPPNQAAWGRIIPTPELSQKSYVGGGGWCSPTSLTMALDRWSQLEHRPDWNFDVPETAASVLDHGRFHGTGNWPFNTAFAGSLPGMRSCVSRFSDISELEDWIAAGIPVMISARWDLLQEGRPIDLDGHLTVCIGFTATGDLVINDPATNLKKDSVRRIYKRANVQRAWATSHNTVYLMYPENWPLPPSRLGHW